MLLPPSSAWVTGAPHTEEKKIYTAELQAKYLGVGYTELMTVFSLSKRDQSFRDRPNGRLTRGSFKERVERYTFWVSHHLKQRIPWFK